MTAAWTLFSNNTVLEVAVFTISGSAALLSVILTAYLIFRHLKHWQAPETQTCIVRILLMVPVYSLVSLLAILIGDYSLYFTLVRDCYEAYVFYQFFSLLTHYVKKEAPAHYQTVRHGIEHIVGEEEVGKLLVYFGEHPFPFPLCCLTYQSNNRMYLHIKRCSLQYVFIKPVLSAIAILLQMIGVYHAGSFKIEYGYFWISAILNVSAALALYFIFLFYDLIKKVIWMHRPLHKLVAIKVLIFFVFWQAMIVGLLYHFHLIPAFFGWSIVRSAETVQNVLICLEMVFLSFFNLYAFPYTSYRTEPGENTLDIALESIQTVLNHKDMVDDTVEAFHPDRFKHALDKRND